jgi:hypothetical protein
MLIGKAITNTCDNKTVVITVDKKAYRLADEYTIIAKG